MSIVVITPETELMDETIAFEHLFEAGLQRLHLRRPEGSEEAMRRSIEAIAPRWYPRLVLHDHPQLALEYGLGGVHLNRRHPFPPDGFAGTVSRSCHSLEEVSQGNYTYCFLSPIFNSVSKSGYKAAFTSEELSEAHRQGILTPRVIALGGITPENSCRVFDWGFGGVALLGWIWAGNAADNYRLLASVIKQKNNHASIYHP